MTESLSSRVKLAAEGIGERVYGITCPAGPLAKEYMGEAGVIVVVGYDGAVRGRPFVLYLGDNHMFAIKVREDESLENALKRFKRKCEKSGILTEIKKRQHYEKPSVKKKRKALAARKKLLKRLAQERKSNA